jgi:hypothetical protein
VATRPLDKNGFESAAVSAELARLKSMLRAAAGDAGHLPSMGNLGNTASSFRKAGA